MKEENVVPLFRTFDELQSDEDKIAADFKAEWEQAYVAYDIAIKAAIDDNALKIQKVVKRDPAIRKLIAAMKPSGAADFEEMLTKLDNVALEHSSLHADVNRMTAEVSALTKLNTDLKTAIARRDDRMFGHGALARRSQRFANAYDRRNRDPGATLPPAS